MLHLEALEECLLDLISPQRHGKVILLKNKFSNLHTKILKFIISNVLFVVYVEKLVTV